MAKKAYTVQSGWEELLKGYVNKYMSDARLKARLQGEGEAKHLLEEKLGRFSEQDIRAFLSALNVDFWNDKERHDRFMPGFYGNLANQIVNSREAFNLWAEKLWHAAAEQLDALLDDFWQENHIAGAGTSLPTAILYLRDPDAYAIWMPALEHGLKMVLPTLKLKKRRTAEGYRLYNEAWQDVREQLGLTPQAMDLVLTLASKETGTTANTEFEALFKEFLSSYVDSEEGQKHLRWYGSLKAEAQKNFQRICEMESRGEDITDVVLLKMLPHSDTEHNRAKGGWIHIAPSITRDIKQWFEGAGWTKPEEWPAVSKAILEFSGDASSNPMLWRNTASGLPITSPQRLPDGHALANPERAQARSVQRHQSKPRQTLNYFYGSDHPNSLQAYPELNKLNFAFQEKHKDLFDEAGQGIALPGDVFDMFSHWLVAVRKFDFKVAEVYKIAPGEQAWNWESCRDEGYIAIGWDELGDISGMSIEEFAARRDKLLTQHPDWTKSAIGQAWRFHGFVKAIESSPTKGNRRFSASVPSLARYCFVANTRHGHRLPVMWDDLTNRKVNEPSWSGMLQKLSAEHFAELRNTETIGKDGTDSQTLVHVVTRTTNPESYRTMCERHGLCSGTA